MQVELHILSVFVKPPGYLQHLILPVQRSADIHKKGNFAVKFPDNGSHFPHAGGAVFMLAPHKTFYVIILGPVGQSFRIVCQYKISVHVKSKFCSA